MQNLKLMTFSEQLTNWYLPNKRDLPWRNTQDPYKIWLSEIILQQTRIEQGLSYYYTFVEKYPTVADLAAAELDAVLKDWEGLGYYSRARNLHFTANSVMDSLNGKFPNSYEELLKLKGVGTYTAAAISSFASKEKRAVVDGNVYRVLGRLYNIEDPIDANPGKKRYQEIADDLISDKYPDLHNQAIMEFGATHCTKHKPKCETCIFQKQCLAFQKNTIDSRPVKKKKNKIQNRYLNFYHIADQNNFLIQQRTDKGIWFQLYQLPLHESLDKRGFDNHIPNLELLGDFEIFSIHPDRNLIHLLSHQKLHIRFWKIEVKELKKIEQHQLVSLADPVAKAFPKPISEFLQNQLKPKLFQK